VQQKISWSGCPRLLRTRKRWHRYASSTTYFMYCYSRWFYQVGLAQRTWIEEARSVHSLLRLIPGRYLPAGDRTRTTVFESSSMLTFFGRPQPGYKSDDKTIFDVLENMAWDLYHVRQMEWITTFNDQLESDYTFHALLTRDQGLIQNHGFVSIASDRCLQRRDRCSARPSFVPAGVPASSGGGSLFRLKPVPREHHPLRRHCRSCQPRLLRRGRHPRLFDL
jgi:hypothetical protein